MNTPIRRLAYVVIAMFTALLLATTWIQFVSADDLREPPSQAIHDRQPAPEERQLVPVHQRRPYEFPRIWQADQGKRDTK